TRLHAFRSRQAIASGARVGCGLRNGRGVAGPAVRHCSVQHDYDDGERQFTGLTRRTWSGRSATGRRITRTRRRARGVLGRLGDALHGDDRSLTRHDGPMSRLLVVCALGVIALASSMRAVQTPAAPGPASGRHTFALGSSDFLLDGAPFQVISCEIHPARIPAEYWVHRIRMAKAMGCNTIAAYVFWNHHEAAEGVFDFNSGNRDLAAFIRAVQKEDLWV